MHRNGMDTNNEITWMTERKICHHLEILCNSSQEIRASHNKQKQENLSVSVPVPAIQGMKNWINIYILTQN